MPTLLLLLALPLPAATVFSQPPTPGPVHVWNITEFRHADDFVLAQPTLLTGGQFWAVGDPSFPAAFSGTLSWAIAQNAGGLPGTILATGLATNITPTNLGIPNFFGNRYAVAFSLDNPFLVAANTSYWLELHEGPTLTTNDGSRVFWITGNPNASPLFAERSLTGNNWITRDEQLAFELNGTTTPEPSTALLVLLGLAAYGTHRRSSRRS